MMTHGNSPIGERGRVNSPPNFSSSSSCPYRKGHPGRLAPPSFGPWSCRCSGRTDGQHWNIRKSMAPRQGVADQFGELDVASWRRWRRGGRTGEASSPTSPASWRWAASARVTERSPENRSSDSSGCDTNQSGWVNSYTARRILSRDKHCSGGPAQARPPLSP